MNVRSTYAALGVARFAMLPPLRQLCDCLREACCRIQLPYPRNDSVAVGGRDKDGSLRPRFDVHFNSSLEVVTRGVVICVCIVVVIRAEIRVRARHEQGVVVVVIVRVRVIRIIVAIVQVIIACAILEKSVVSVRGSYNHRIEWTGGARFGIGRFFRNGLLPRRLPQRHGRRHQVLSYRRSSGSSLKKLPIKHASVR